MKQLHNLGANGLGDPSWAFHTASWRLYKDRITICDKHIIFEDDEPQREPFSDEEHHTIIGGVHLGPSNVTVILDEPGEGPAMNVSMAANISEMMKESPTWTDAKKANNRLKTMLKVANAISTLHEPQNLLPEIMIPISRNRSP